MINLRFTAPIPVIGIMMCMLMCGVSSSVSAERQVQKETVKTTTYMLKNSNDQEMRNQLDHLIDSRRELDDDVGFEVKDGTITLRGVVDNDSERELTERLAKEINGVVKVENTIRVE